MNDSYIILWTFQFSEIYRRQVTRQSLNILSKNLTTFFTLIISLLHHGKQQVISWISLERSADFTEETPDRQSLNKYFYYFVSCFNYKLSHYFHISFVIYQVTHTKVFFALLYISLQKSSLLIQYIRQDVSVISYSIFSLYLGFITF